MPTDKNLVHPDLKKIGLIAGSGPGGRRDKQTFSKFLKADAVVDYWEGEL